MELKLNRHNYENIGVGDVWRFKKLIDETALRDFGSLTGDQNPLHVDADYARKSGFGDRVVYGMLLGGLFSTLVGMLCPGERSLYLSQTLNFRQPLLVNRRVIVEGKVINKFDAARVIELATVVKDETGAVLVDGVAKVKVR